MSVSAKNRSSSDIFLFLRWGNLSDLRETKIRFFSRLKLSFLTGRADEEEEEEKKEECDLTIFFAEITKVKAILKRFLIEETKLLKID